MLSYVAIMSVYASALASYSVNYLPEAMRPAAHHIIASAAVVLFGVINFLGAALMEKLETFFNVGKLGVLALFIVAGFLVGQLEWTRLEPAAWAPTSTIVASGMLGFLAYEGFELISNASADIENPKRTLPIALLGSVVIAIVIYVLAVVVAIGHMSFEQAAAAQDFAVSAAAGTFLGPIGFAIMSIGAVLASASAINADFFGAGKLPPLLAAAQRAAVGLPAPGARPVADEPCGHRPPCAHRRQLRRDPRAVERHQRRLPAGLRCGEPRGDPPAPRDRREPPSCPALALALCVIALVVMLAQFLSSSATIPSAIAVAAIVLLSLAIELAFRLFDHQPSGA